MSEENYLKPNSVIGMLGIEDALHDWIPDNDYVVKEIMGALKFRDSILQVLAKK